MYGQSALGVVPPAEGVPISGVYYYRASSVIAGGECGLRAGPGGVSIGRFGWADLDGIVRNARNADTDILGLVVIQMGDWRRVYWDTATHSWHIREGLGLTMLSGAPGMWISFPSGAYAGARVYTSPLDGVPIAGQADDLEVTPWVVGQPAGPGGLSLVTTWNPRT